MGWPNTERSDKGMLRKYPGVNTDARTCGKIGLVRPSAIRQCLKLLTDIEIDELLAASAALRDAIRKSLAAPKGDTLTASKFNRWLAMPARSDKLLSTLPAMFAGEMHSRGSDIDGVVSGVGARTILYLDELDTAGKFSIELFAQKLEELRTTPTDDIGVPDPVSPQARDLRPAAEDFSAMLDLLRREAEDLQRRYRSAAEQAVEGLPVDGLSDVTLAWNDQLADLWARARAGGLNVDGAGFSALVEVERLLVELEASDAQEREQHDARLAELAELQRMVTSLDLEIGLGGPLAKHKKASRDSAQTAIDELVSDLGLNENDLLAADKFEATLSSAAAPYEDDHADLGLEAPGEIPDADKLPVDEASSVRSLPADQLARPVAPTDNVELGNSSDAALDASSQEVRDAAPIQARSAAFEEAPTTLRRNDCADQASGDEQLAEGASTAVSDPGMLERAKAVEVDLAHHLRRRDYAAAWWVCRAADATSTDADAYRLALAAFGSGPGGFDPVDVLSILTSWPSDQQFSTPAVAQVALAATLRASLAAGWVPRSELERIDKQANLDGRWRQLVDEVVSAADRNYRHLQAFTDGVEPSSDDVRARCRQLRDQLTKSRISFARANKVQRHLLRGSEPLGAALNAVEANTVGEPRRNALGSSLQLLRSPDSIIDSADATTSSPQQRRNPIVAHSRSTLLRNIELVTECVTDALRSETVVAHSPDVAAAHGLLAAAQAIEPLGDDLGSLAMRHLAEWIAHPERPRPQLSTIDAALQAASLPIADVKRDSAGMPVLAGATLTVVMASLRQPAATDVLFDSHARRGDLESAAAVAKSEPALLQQLPDRTQKLQRELAREVERMRAELARTVAADITDQSKSAYSEWEAALVAPSSFVGSRFDLQMETLATLGDAFAQRRSNSARRLRDRVHNEIADATDRNRVDALIEAEDFIGAYELLSLAKADKRLPPTIPTEQGTAFDGFMAAINLLDSNMTIREVVSALGQTDAGEPRKDSELGRLNAWSTMNDILSPRHTRRATEDLSAVLRALGLDVRGPATISTPKGVRHYARVRVLATSMDGSLVPGLGSQASHYDVVIASDAKQLTQILVSAFPSNRGPNILLFTGVLSAEQRRKCLAVCRENRTSAIVVDFAVSAYVAAYRPQSFKLVQQLTLPFTCFHHYTVVAGNVPDEVFVGRADELAELAARDGSLFVYGGRQLGKSALLRKIQRDFSSVPDQHAVFIDLNAHGIGSWAEPSQLWPVLFEELRQIGGIVPKGVANVRTYQKVVEYIQEWLKSKETRRLLVLLDEADAFLEKESRTSKDRFANILPLKRMFDDFGGRFKPIFAGLHKVQRLQNVSNTPLAHGGRDILIGPLGAGAARDLVVKPLEALGYQFADPELVWRLLAFTNMQAGLIQVVCADLIKHLQSRPLRGSEPLIEVTGRDVEFVTTQPRTREKIAEKLRLTIELEERYRVIAVAVAIQSMEDNFTEQYSADDIQALCELYWLEGFEELNTSQFAVYLDELVGLGVLIESDNKRFAVRSPNIVTMLGTKDQLSRELEENKQQFELPQEYNAQATRRIVQASAGATKVHSPLSEHDLAILLPVKARYDASTFAVVGSSALGVGDVTTVLAVVAAERNIEIEFVDGGTEDVRARLNSYKFSAGSSRPRTLVVNGIGLNQIEANDVAMAVRAMPRRNRGHLVVVYGAAGVQAARIVGDLSDKSTMIALEKWSGDGLRAWVDNPLSARASERKELLLHSGGWPGFIAEAVGAVSRGGSLKEQWVQLAAFPADVSAAEEFLASVGLQDAHKYLFKQWTQLVDPGDFQAVDELASVIDIDIDELQVVADDMSAIGIVDEHQGLFAVDRVVGRAINAL